MQTRTNKNSRKLPSDRLKGLAGTILIHLGVIAMLFLFGFSMPVNLPSDQGILVNFGTGETGLGLIEPSPPAGREETSPPLSAAAPTPAASSTKSDEGPLITQNNGEAPVLKKVDPEAEKKRLEKIEANKKHREEVEAERVTKEQEEIEKKKIEAEQKRQADIMNRTKNALANSRNAGTNSTSEGINGGTGNQGVPTGSVDSQNRGDGSGTGNSGVSYDLQGRGFQKLPLPKYDYQGEGRVVVEVSVDRSGKVIQAIPGRTGSTTLDEYLLKVAKDAALQATFKVKADAPEIQKGTITYIFILK